MKKLSQIYFAIITLFTLFSTPVFALDSENDLYFRTNTGVELSKKEYNNLQKGFDNNTLNNLSPDLINYLKVNTNLKMIETIKFVKNENIYDQGKLISTKETEVSEYEYNNSGEKAKIKIKKKEPLEIILMYSGNTGYYIHETTYKKIVMYWTAAWSTDRIITIKNTWKQLPLYRSYDVMAIAPQNTALTIGLNTKSGYQKYDGATINYSSGSSNFKIPSVFGILKKGVGLSQNLVDSASISIENSMTVHFVSNEMPFYVRGSYQHATSNVSLAQSQNYTLSTSGMGGTILFDSSVDQYYDDTQGVLCKIDSLTDTSCS